MPAALILPVFFSAAEIAAGGLLVGAATLAIHLASTLILSSLLRTDQPNISGGNTGGKVQLPPATDNVVPVVYGDAWIAPIVTDAKMSTDQQTMWYALTFCEATDSGDINFGEVYWDDKLLIFDPANPNEILGWYIQGDNTTIYGVAGKISMWFYKNGSLVPTTHYCRKLDGTGGGYKPTTQSAISVMSDSTINGAKWTNKHTMKNTVFAVVRVNYDQNVGITGLGQVKAKIQNTLKQPGSVMIDYLHNPRYGAGIDYANINLQSFQDLDAYSAQNQVSVPIGDHPYSFPRYEINGYIDPTRDCLTNLASMADNADSWVQWNEALGAWGVAMNRNVEDRGLTNAELPLITADNIIGGIQVSPLDLNSSYNNIEVNFPNAYFWNPTTSQQVLDSYRGQTDYRYSSIPAAQRASNEPDNKLTISLAYCNNSVQATYIAYKRLFASREDLIINFTMDYSGIQIDANDIICISHEWYGWTAGNYGNQTFPGKPFRVTQVREMKSEDGFLSAQITASAYNPEIYNVVDPHYFTPASFSTIADPSNISQPTAPTFRLDLGTSGTSYVVQGDIPSTGNTLGMEFWYSVKGADLVANNYTLYGTQYYASTGTTATTQTSIYPHTQANGTSTYYEQIQAVGLPTNTYWWRTRALGPNNSSQFSYASTSLAWTLTAGGTGVINNNNIANGSITAGKLASGTSAQPSQSNGIFDNLGPILGVGLVGLAAYGIYNKGFTDIFGSSDPVQGGGNDAGTTPIYPTTIIQDEFGTPINQAYVGDTINIVTDTTAPQPNTIDYASNVGFSDYGITNYAPDYTVYADSSSDGGGGWDPFA